MKINHIITGLDDGGAEAVLYRLCISNKVHDHCVISLSTMGKYGNLLKSQGIPVYALGMQRGRPSISSFVRLLKLLQSYKPDLVQTWMYHSDLLGGLVARMVGIKTVVWGIRQTDLIPEISNRTTIWIARLLAILSWVVPKRIVVCAQRAIDVHVALGYNRTKMSFIPNGYDLTKLKPNKKHKESFRNQIGVKPEVPLIGMVGRYDPQKDHRNLLNALSILHKSKLSFKCILIGKGVDYDNTNLMYSISELGLTDIVQPIGQSRNIPQWMNAIDIHVLSSSFGEGFPNVVAESMACGTPCVVTDVGDAAYIVGDTGWVVPPKNPEALAKAMESALTELTSQEWQKRGQRARKRIEENFSIERMVLEYNRLWNIAKE